MITQNKPISYNAVPTTFGDLLSSASRNLYVIEVSLQRPYVWNSITIEALCKELAEVFCANILNGKKCIYDRAYLELDEIICSEVDDHNKTQNIFHIKDLIVESIVEGSQRIRTLCVVFLFLLFLFSHKKEEEYVDLEMFKNSDDEYKVRIIGDDNENELDKLITYISTTKTKNIFKEFEKTKLDKFRNKFSDSKEKNLHDLFFYIGNLFYNVIEENSLDVEKCIQVFLNNGFVYKRQVSKEEKIRTFITCNRLIVPMSEEHLYPKLIINRVSGEERGLVNNAYKSFMNVVHEIEKNSVYVKTKTGAKAELFIETNVLDLQLARKGVKTLKYGYKLGDYDYGIEAVMNKGWHLTTFDDIIEYFSECKAYAEFILNSLKYKEDKSKNTYYFNSIWSSKNGLWWSFYTPCYIMCNYIHDEDKRISVNNLLYKSYIQFILAWGSGTSNRDSYSNLLYKLSNMILNNLDTEYSLFNGKCEAIMSDQINYNDNSWDKLYNSTKLLSYEMNPRMKTAIFYLLLTSEKYLIDLYGFSDAHLYDVWVKKDNCDLDHWLPNSLTLGNDELHDECNRVGNFVLLEKNLNQSKSNNLNANSKIYMQSKFISTNILCSNYICDISLAKKSLLCNDENIVRFSDDIIDNPKIDDIKNRRYKLVNLVLSYIKPN